MNNSNAKQLNAKHMRRSMAKLLFHLAPPSKLLSLLGSSSRMKPDISLIRSPLWIILLSGKDSEIKG